jgi:protein-S-isoprenylcysteine O-methyltransferase Ste14
MIGVNYLLLCSLSLSSTFALSSYFCRTRHSLPPSVQQCSWLLGRSDIIHPFKVPRYNNVLASMSNDEEEMESSSRQRIPSSSNVTALSTKNTTSASSSAVGITALQVLVAGSCLVGRLPILNPLVSLVLEKGLLLLLGLTTMGLAWYQWKAASKGNLVTTGLFSQVRHPFCAGQLLALLGWAGAMPGPKASMRFLLIGLYYLVLRKKTQLEEEELISKYGFHYEVYKVLVKGKLIPHEWSTQF